MKKHLLFSLLLSTSIQFVTAQTANVKDLYWNFTEYRMTPDKKPEAIQKSMELLIYKSKLNEKQQANINYHIGRMYEETGELEKSVPFYEETIRLSPGYYVPYRALGFMNVKKCNALTAAIKEATAQKNEVAYSTSFAAYKKQVLITLPFLEKTQACDPDDQTLDMITKFYTSIKDSASVASLPERLKKLEENCVTLLEDQ